MKHNNNLMGFRDLNEQLKVSNRDAWKYESLYKYRPLFSYKKIFKSLFQIFLKETKH